MGSLGTSEGPRIFLGGSLIEFDQKNEIPQVLKKSAHWKWPRRPCGLGAPGGSRCLGVVPGCQKKIQKFIFVFWWCASIPAVKMDFWAHLRLLDPKNLQK